MISEVFNYLGYLNNSKFFAGLVMIMLNIGSKYVTIELSKSQEAYLKNSVGRQLLIFAISWMGSRVKNRITRRNRPKPENQQQVADQKQAAFLKFKDKLHPELEKLKEAEDKIRKKIKDTIEGPDDNTGKKQRDLETEYDKILRNTDEKLMLMNMVNENLDSANKSNLTSIIQKSRVDYSNRGRIPLAPRNVAFNVPY